MAILWLASFPKSGNTWMRAFLANYLHDAREPLSLDQVNRFGYTDAAVWAFNDLGYPDPRKITPELYFRLLPKLHELLSQSSADNVVVKTHNSYAVPGGHPLFSEATTHAAIHIVRNPWDVAVSYADHFGMSLEKAANELAEPGLGIQATANRAMQAPCGWTQHTTSWRAAPFRRISVRYEDLVAKPEETFGKVIQFMQLPDEPERLDRAIQFSSFDTLAAMEAADGFPERSKFSERFFRSGKVGGWRDVMPRELERRITKDHRRTLKALDYISDTGRIRVG